MPPQKKLFFAAKRSGIEGRALSHTSSREREIFCCADQMNRHVLVGALVGALVVIFILYQKSRVPRLPIITPLNKSEYPEWHEYIERVYREPVTRKYDLNTFNFFYHFSPLKVLPIQQHLILALPVRYRRNIAIKQNWSPSPESKIYRVGFLVTRELPRMQERVEVIRTQMPRANANMWESGEEKCAWFYHAIGSGMFIDCVQPRTLESRECFISQVGEAWRCDDDDFVHDVLLRHGISCVAFNTPPFSKLPKREIIIRLTTPNKSTCPIRVEFQNGETCVCKDSQVMECS